MEGRVWRRPLAVVQKFESDEYVAACGDSGVVYNFECNAGESDHEYAVYTYNKRGKKNI